MEFLINILGTLAPNRSVGKLAAVIQFTQEESDVINRVFSISSII